MNRDLLRTFYARAQAMGQDMFDPDAPADDGNPFGEPEAQIHWQVDVTPWLAQRRAALECHRSQVTDIGMMLAMPPEMFAAAFGVEHYREPGRPDGMRRGWWLDATS